MRPLPASRPAARAVRGYVATLLASLLLPAAARAVAAAAPAGSNTVVVATWNVENLFDSFDDPDNPGDDEYTPRGGMYWSYPRYRQKLTNLAEVVALMRPDILCLQEIENRRVLNDLSFVVERVFDWPMPVIIHREGADPRGIDVAIIARYEPRAIAWLSPGAGRRDQIVATFDIDGRELTVCCNHWKSKLGDPELNARARAEEARTLAADVRRRLRETPTAAIIAAGDFNDQFDCDTMINEAGFLPWPPAAATKGKKALLHNLSGIWPHKARGTYYYSKNRVWNSLDSMSVSPGMLPDAARPAPWVVMTNTYERFISPIQTNAAGYPLSYWRALRTETGRLKVGVSDHFPVRVELRAGGAGGGGPPAQKEKSFLRRLWLW